MFKIEKEKLGKLTKKIKTRHTVQNNGNQSRVTLSVIFIQYTRKKNSASAKY